MRTAVTSQWAGARRLSCGGWRAVGGRQLEQHQIFIPPAPCSTVGTWCRRTRYHMISYPSRNASLPPQYTPRVNKKTRRKAKPDVSPPDYAPSRLRPFSSMHYFSLCPTTHAALPKLRNSIVWPEIDYANEAHKIGCHVNVP